MSKSRGGMGFKSLFGFNIALLGKQVWKCIEQPELLVSRILKARYFAGVHVLNAGRGQGSSFVWQGFGKLRKFYAGVLDGWLEMVEVS